MKVISQCFTHKHGFQIVFKGIHVIFESYSGIRIPAQAVQTDPETESTYVWCVTAMQLERKDVTVIYEDEDFAIVARDSAADALREGNTVVVRGHELYEGKVMG